MPEHQGTFGEERCLVTANANYFVPIILLQNVDRNILSANVFPLPLRRFPVIYANGYYSNKCYFMECRPTGTIHLRI
jgi:hypothetical protein